MLLKTIIFWDYYWMAEWLLLKVDYKDTLILKDLFVTPILRFLRETDF